MATSNKECHVAIFFLEETIIDFIYIESCYTMGKRKEGYSSNQTMISSFSFAKLANAEVARLHHKYIPTKEIKSKLSQIILMSSRSKLLQENKSSPQSFSMPIKTSKRVERHPRDLLRHQCGVEKFSWQERGL